MTTKSYSTAKMLNNGPVTKANLATGVAYVTAVSFDPTGSGRKDHIAYVGFNVDSKMIIDLGNGRQRPVRTQRRRR
jgi:hypothetical protein